MMVCPQPMLAVQSRSALVQNRFPVTGLPRYGGAATRHTAITTTRSQRCAGSASMRGCHMAEIAISGVRTGSSKAARPSVTGSALPRQDRGTSAIRSDRRAIRIASGKAGHNGDDLSLESQFRQSIVNRPGEGSSA